MGRLSRLILRLLGRPGAPALEAASVNLLSFHDPRAETYDDAVDQAVAFLVARGGGAILVPPGSFTLRRAHPLPPGVRFEAWKPGRPEK